MLLDCDVINRFCRWLICFVFRLCRPCRRSWCVCKWLVVAFARGSGEGEEKKSVRTPYVVCLPDTVCSMYNTREKIKCSCFPILHPKASVWFWDSAGMSCGWAGVDGKTPERRCGALAGDSNTIARFPILHPNPSDAVSGCAPVCNVASQNVLRSGRRVYEMS